EVELLVDYDDAYPLDNRAYGLLPDPRMIPVMLVSEGNLFLESALRTDDEINFTMATPAEYNPAEADPEAVTIFDRWAPDTTPPGNAIFLSRWPADLAITPEGAINDVIITDWAEDHAINRHVTLTNITIKSAQK